MNFSKQRLSIEEARQTDMVDYLSNLGYEPAKVRGHDYWYLSPLRGSLAQCSAPGCCGNGDGRSASAALFAMCCGARFARWSSRLLMKIRCRAAHVAVVVMSGAAFHASDDVTERTSAPLLSCP